MYLVRLIHVIYSCLQYHFINSRESTSSSNHTVRKHGSSCFLVGQGQIIRVQMLHGVLEDPRGAFKGNGFLKRIPRFLMDKDIQVAHLQNLKCRVKKALLLSVQEALESPVSIVPPEALSNPELTAESK